MIPELYHSKIILCRLKQMTEEELKIHAYENTSSCLVFIKWDSKEEERILKSLNSLLSKMLTRWLPRRFILGKSLYLWFLPIKA